MTKTLADAQALYEDHLRQAGKAHATIIAYTKDIEQLIDFVGKKGKHASMPALQESCLEPPPTTGANKAPKPAVASANNSSCPKPITVCTREIRG